jgi:hypothetical protein
MGRFDSYDTHAGVVHIVKTASADDSPSHRHQQKLFWQVVLRSNRASDHLARRFKRPSPNVTWCR